MAFSLNKLSKPKKALLFPKKNHEHYLKKKRMVLLKRRKSAMDLRKGSYLLLVAKHQFNLKNFYRFF